MKHCYLEQKAAKKEDRKKYLWCKGFCAIRTKAKCHHEKCPKFHATLWHKIVKKWRER